MVNKITLTLALCITFLLSSAQSSLKFDGTATGQIVPDSTALTFSNLTGLTFTAWVKSSWAGNGYVFELADSAGYRSGNTGFRFAMLDRRAGGFPPSNELAFETTFDNLTVRAATNMNNVPSNEWVHLAGVISRSALNGNTATYSLELFVNGNSVATSTDINVNNADPAVRNLHLSKNSRSRIGNIIIPPRFGNNRFTGNVDDIIFYDHALTSTEIKAMVCNRSYPSNGKILYYNCNEASGTTAYDISPTSANAELGAGASWDDVDFVSGTVSVPVAQFGYTTTSPSLMVSFSDSSSPAISRKWEFGDGDTSAMLNPNHVYAKEGTYQVSLVITDGCGNMSAKVTKSVVVSCPVAKATFVNSTTDRKIDVEANKQGVLRYTWNFGDGNPLDTSSTDNKNSHIYANYGVYTVCLYVESACGMDTLCEEISLATAGFGENNSNNMWTFYPNPAKDVLNVSFTKEFEAVELMVKDIQGRIVIQESSLVGSQNQVDISKLDSGFYTIEMKIGDSISSKKFLKD